MKILHISNTRYPLMPGLELFIFNLLEYHSAKGYKAYHICNSCHSFTQ